MDPDFVRLLDIVPALGEGLTGGQRREARRLAVAPVVTLAAGEWDASELGRRHPRCSVFGCMIVDGLVAHDLVLDDRCATYLLGPGDIVAPCVPPSTTLALARRFTLADDTRLALLDETIPAVARRWPSIAGQLLLHAERHVERIAVQQLISQLPRAEQRIVAIMWHLADRWGQTERDGVLLPLTLSHEAISHLVGGRRPTVSAALGHLADHNLVVRLSNDTWWLAHESRAPLDQAPAPRPTPGVRFLGGSVGRLLNRPAARLLE